MKINLMKVEEKPPWMLEFITMLIWVAATSSWLYIATRYWFK